MKTEEIKKRSSHKLLRSVIGCCDFMVEQAPDDMIFAKVLRNRTSFFDNEDVKRF